MVNVKRLSFILILALALAISFTSVGMAKDKNIVNVWMWEINNWDPNLCNSDGARILSNIYEQLLRYEDGKLTPVLATSWEKADGGKVWTFKLRTGRQISQWRSLQRPCREIFPGADGKTRIVFCLAF